MLALGTDSARKNFAVLGAAAAGAPGGGASSWSPRAAAAPTCAAAAAPGRTLGYVPERHLPGLYAGARRSRCPRCYEGFGLPCLEAMACGTPVVAADRAALPETCGGAALLADPGDPEAFAAALVAAAGPDARAPALTAPACERAAGFSWERSAELADAVVGELLDWRGSGLVAQHERPAGPCRRSPAWLCR